MLEGWILKLIEDVKSNGSLEWTEKGTKSVEDSSSKRGEKNAARSRGKLEGQPEPEYTTMLFLSFKQWCACRQKVRRNRQVIGACLSCGLLVCLGW